VSILEGKSFGRNLRTKLLRSQLKMLKNIGIYVFHVSASKSRSWAPVFRCIFTVF
jgi:hypothetical protein